MDATIYSLHLQAGYRAGHQRTCDGKIRFSSEETATKVALKMNAKPTRRHEVEAYPCVFCGKWHTGRKMAFDLLDRCMLVHMYGGPEALLALNALDNIGRHRVLMRLGICLGEN